MKVLQILPALELGGVERGVLDLARSLKARGVEGVVISGGGALVRELEREGIHHYTLPVGRKSPFVLSLVPKILEIIQKERVEVVHARSRVPGWLAWLAARKAGVPFVTTCHGYYSKHLLSCVMGWGRKVIVPSQVIARHMIEDFGVPPERIVHIPRGVDLTQFPFYPDKYGGPAPKIFRVLNLGRFSPIKGQAEFLRAVHRLRQEGVPVEAWLAGSLGTGKPRYTKEIEQTIHSLGLEKWVKILGARRDVPELLRQADVLVLSSLVPESFGRVLIEAGAAGTACVATKLGGALEIIEDGKEGLLVPPRDETAMAQAIARLLLNRNEAGEMAGRLRERVEREFSLEQMTARTLEVYREIKDQKRILVMKWGALGDVILAVPSLRMIRKRFPSAYVSLLVDARFAPVVSGCPYVNEIIPLDRKKIRSWWGLARLAKRLRLEDFDLSIDFQNTKRTHLLAFLAGVPGRYGFRRGLFGGLLNHPDLNFRTADSPVQHQFRLLSRVGVTCLDEKLELWPDPELEVLVQDRLPSEGGGATKRVGLAIGSSPRWPTKRWPIESFRALAQRLAKEGCQMILIGSEEDRILAGEFADGDRIIAAIQTRHSEPATASMAGEESQAEILCRSAPQDDVEGSERLRIINLVGRTSLAELVALIKQLDVLVTGDTAPLHIAAALDVPAAALFGPTDPRRHVPEGSRVTVLSRRLPCQPCYKGACHYSETLACLKRIGVEEVLEVVQKRLSAALLRDGVPGERRGAPACAPANTGREHNGRT